MSEDGKNVFEMSIDTRMLYEALKKVEIGETIRFAVLGETIGRKVSGGTPNLQSALHRLLGEGKAFANVRGVGYQRMTDVDVVNSAEREREGLRQKAKRAGKRLTCVHDFERLPNELKIKHNAALSAFGAIAACMSPARMKQVEEQVAVSRAQLPLARTLQAFMV